MSAANMTVPEVAEVLPDIVDSLGRQCRISKPPADGVKRGRPTKDSETFNVWNWLHKNRSGLYTKEHFEDGEIRLRCTMCKALLKINRDSSNNCVLQHERTEKHRLAGGDPDELHMCSGIPMARDDVEEELEPFVEAFELWASADFPWIKHTKGTGSSHASYRSSEGVLMLRSSDCKEKGHFCMPEKPWCVHCDRLSKNATFRERFCRWGFRIFLVDFLQASQVDDMEKQRSLMVKYRENACLQPEYTKWPDVADVFKMSFPQLYMNWYGRKWGASQEITWTGQLLHSSNLDSHGYRPKRFRRNLGHTPRH